jgi:diguanylate cyclase (GGDEF)-like protein/PAS domain S-box-containing protein
MERSGLDTQLRIVGWTAVSAVLVVTPLNWVGWATGNQRLTRFVETWPQMTPWTALWLAALGLAILVQWGHPSQRRVLVARSLAVVVAALAVATLAQYVTGASFGIDRLWFGDAVGKLQSSWPGRPSPQTAVSALLLAGAVALLRVDRAWVRLAWPLCIVGALVIPVLTTSAYLFDAMSLVHVAPSTGQAMSTALALILLHIAASVARPDRLPISWLLARRDRQALLRLGGVLAGFPLIVGSSRLILLRAGLPEQSAWTVAIAVGTLVVGAGTFYLSQRVQKLLIAQETASRERADAEKRYRIIAENAVDVIMHLRGNEIAWFSPSVEAALGGALHRWIGSDSTLRVHPYDLDALGGAQRRIFSGEAVLQRFRVRSADSGYHWVDGHGKPYLDADGNTDGLIAALRIVDDEVEAEQRLEQLARFEMLTGLANRAEAIARLEAVQALPPVPGTHLGILYCDVDHFKDINDTWGHGVGDTVLTTLAARICECVRPDDTVGRTGGDEILVLLPGVHNLDEAALIAEKIRCRVAEPIREAGQTIHVTLSIGATIALSGEPVAAITARADAAMYQAKMGNRNTVIRIEAAG